MKTIYRTKRDNMFIMIGAQITVASTIFMLTIFQNIILKNIWLFIIALISIVTILTFLSYRIRKGLK